MIRHRNPAASSSQRSVSAAARILAPLAGAALLSASLLAQQIPPPRTMLINPRAIAVNPATHRMYAVDQPAGRVMVFDPATAATTSIPVGKAPDALSIDPLANRIYVANTGSNSVSVIDGAKEAVVATIPAGHIPYAIQVDPPLHRVLVTNTYSDFVTEIDGPTNHVAELPFGAKDAIAIDTKLHRVYLLGYEDPALTVFDETSRAKSRAPAVMHLWGLAVDEPHSILYATEAESRALLAIHEDSGAAVTVPTGAMPCAAAVDPRSGMVYVLNYADNSVTLVDGPAGKAVATILVGNHPEAIAIDPSRHRVYVANTHSNNVSVIDESSRKVVATLPGGRNPYAIAVDPGRGDVYTANFGTPSFTRLNTSALPQ